MTTEQTVVYVINITGGAFDLYSNHSTVSCCVFIQCLIIHVSMSFCLYHYSNGHLKIVEWLITNGADVNSKDGDRWTPLHWACL